MILNLEDELGSALKGAKSFFIATALITKAGYDLIEKNRSSDCICSYMVGIDLAISPLMLKTLLEKTRDKITRARICKPQYTFHPKVYLIENFDGSYVAFIGSANTTHGGLSNNMEMSVRVNSQEQCIEILKWFNNLYESSMEITQELIDEYSLLYTSLKQRQKVNKSDFEKFRSELPTSGMISKDLRRQYFVYEDFEAFSPAYQRISLLLHAKKESGSN